MHQDNVLYIGNFFDGTGWSRACYEMVLAADAGGLDVYCRPLKMSSGVHLPPQRIMELTRSGPPPDAVIQHVLPHLFTFDRSCGKNICLFASETTNFRAAGWTGNLNLADEVWVINRQSRQACIDSGVTRPIRVIPHPTDTSRYDRLYSSFAPLERFRNQGDFLFYFIGELVERKNLRALLRAFHTEFSPSEPVRLVLKLSCPGLDGEAAMEKARDFCKSVRDGMRLWKGREEIIITGRLTDDEVCSLHQACHCFVTASRGEAWMWPGFDALGFGKTPVIPSSTGFLDWGDSGSCFWVDTFREGCHGVSDAIEGVYSSLEEWFEPNHLSLRRAMRTAYTMSHQQRTSMAAAGRARAEMFSREHIGRLIHEVLTDGNNRGQEMDGTPVAEEKRNSSTPKRRKSKNRRAETVRASH